MYRVSTALEFIRAMNTAQQERVRYVQNVTVTEMVADYIRDSGDSSTIHDNTYAPVAVYVLFLDLESIGSLGMCEHVTRT